MKSIRIEPLLDGLRESAPAGAESRIAVGIAPDGSVSAATPLGTFTVELSPGSLDLPDVVTSVQHDIASSPREIARYPLRKFLAMFLRALRVARRRGAVDRVLPAPSLPRSLRQAQRVALAQFLRANFRVLMLLAHARPGQLALWA
jgi:hypothetical protein